MNNQIPSMNKHLNSARENFVKKDRARLFAELQRERQRYEIAQDQLVYSKRFYRTLVGILLVLMCVMYGGLWYAKNILSNGCM